MNQGTPASYTRTLQTARLVLRPLAAPDAPVIHRISNEPAVRRYLWDDAPVTSAHIEEGVAQSVRMFSEEGVGLFGVRLRDSPELVGFCGFGLTLDGPEEIELIYELLLELWGRGLVTEASRACLRHAFVEAGLDRVPRNGVLDPEPREPATPVCVPPAWRSRGLACLSVFVASLRR